MASLRVFQVCVLGGSGGAEHHTLALAKKLAATLEVTVVTAEGGWLFDAARAAGLDVIALPEPRGNFDVRTLLALRRAVRERRPDIVHSHLGRSDWYCWLALFGARQVRFVSTEHGLSAENPELFVRGARRAAHETGHSLRLRRCDAVIAVSQATADALLARYPVLRRRRLDVIPPGIDTATFADHASARRREGEPLRVVSVARLAPEKGVDVAIDAIGLCRDRGTDCLLVVAGEGPERKALLEQAGARGLSEAVTLLGRLDSVTGVLGDAHVFLLASRSENLPIALLEGMASGLPAVAARSGGIPEIVTDGLEGILVPPGDAAAIAAALGTLADDENLRRAMGDSARSKALQYDSQQSADAVRRLYGSL